MLLLSIIWSFWFRISKMLVITFYLINLINTGYPLVTWSLPDDLSSSSPISKTIGYNTTIDFNRKQAFLTRSGFTQILYNYIDSNVNHLYQHQVTLNCIKSLINLNRSLENGDPWAFKLLDASGRAPVDLTGFGYVDMGNFDQCLQLDWINVNGVKEMGQHCLTSVTPNPPNPGTVADLFTSRKILIDYDEGYSMRIGFCIPSSCSANDLKIILNKALEPFSWSLLRVDSCQIAKSFSEKFWSAPSFQKISFFSLSLFVFLVIYATWKEHSIQGELAKTSNKQNQHRPVSSYYTTRSWTHSFSIVTNWKLLNEPDKEMSRCPTLAKCALAQHFVVLHFHAVIWPIITNALTIYAIGNPIVRYRESQIIRGLFGEWYMDGLFAYAGATKALELWKKITPETSIWRVFSIIIRKMLILNILFIILIMIESITPLLSYGPFNPLIAERRAEICSQTYTANLLFYHNYNGSLEKLCSAHSWSLAAEYQLVFYLAILVYLYKRLPRLALTLNVLIITGGLIHVARVFHHHNLSPHPLAHGFHPSIVTRWAELVYLPSEMHLWLYLGTPLLVYLIMDPPSAKIPMFFIKNAEKVERRLWLNAIFLMLYPFITTLISTSETPVINTVHIIIYRLLTGHFYSILGLHNGAEFREYFKPKESLINNNNNEPVSSETITKTTEQFSVINENNKSENNNFKVAPDTYRKIHIATIIFRSTYCIHVPVLIWYYSQHKWPVITTFEWIFHLFSTIFLSLACGLVFYLLILGPVNNLTEQTKPQNLKDIDHRLKKE